MQAMETERSPILPSLIVTTRRRLMPHGTSCSFLHAVTQALHSMQRSASQRNFIRAMCRSSCSRWPDLAERDFGFLHPGNRVVTVCRDCIGAIAEHKGVGALWIGRPQILTLEPAAEMERHEGDALADALRHESLHPRLRAVLGAGYPHPGAVSDAALGGIPRVDLHEHLLLRSEEHTSELQSLMRISYAVF